MALETATCERNGKEITLNDLQPVPLRRFPHEPSVSVLITCFNYGAYVGEAIESALEQSYPPTEIIVGDDGSEDNSCEVVESYVQRGFPVVLLRNPHGGMASNLNAAYRKSSGDVVCLLDADDTFLPGKIEAVVNAFRDHPDAGFAIHRAGHVDYANRTRGVFPLLIELPSGDCAQATYDDAGLLLGLPPTSNLALRREVADRIFPIPLGYTGYAEQTIQRLAPFMTELCAIDAPLATWKLHGRNDQNSNRVTARRLERELQILETLWQEQKRYLESVDKDLADAFPSIQRNALYMQMNYIRHRLNGDPASRQAYTDLCQHGLRTNSGVDRFWRFSNLLPKPLFQIAVDLFITPSLWKEMVFRATRGRKTRSRKAKTSPAIYPEPRRS